jgi:glutaryl-CoA dehydrogenase
MSQTPTPLDFLDLDRLLSEEERLIRDTTRDFVADKVLPEIAGWFERGHFPRELAKELGGLGLLGMHLEGYGCAGTNAVSYGLACLELEAGDSGARSFVSVQGSLAMYPIWRYGSEEQKRRWLPAMAAGEVIGCFGLTEPGAGSNPGEMGTTARRDGGDWVLDGTKRWIGMGSIADVAVVWARMDDGIRGFLVEAGTRGLTARDITGKHALRASLQSELLLEGCRVPGSALLPGAEGLRGPFTCLNEARFGIAWGAVGAAMGCFESALNYAKIRPQFGKPIAAFQGMQFKLADMETQCAAARELLYKACAKVDRHEADTGKYSAMAKLFCSDTAMTVTVEAVQVLGGYGYVREYPVERYLRDAKVTQIYEGTNEIQRLVIARSL